MMRSGCSASRQFLGVAVGLTAWQLLSGCSQSERQAPSPVNSVVVVPPRFVDVAQESGIDFVHHHGGCGRKYFPETMVGGSAFFDCDEDGDLDLYLVQSAATPGYTGPPIGGNALYVNDGTGRFRRANMTGAEDEGYGVGCVAADYDNDGDQDLYVANYGPNVLLRNTSEGRFEDVTAAAGVSGGDAFTSDATFGDYDRDGDLDLYVVNYVVYRWGMEDDWRPLEEPVAYGGPPSFRGEPGALFRNNGDGTFSDVTREAGLYSENGKGMDAFWFDYDEDNWPDLFVTNDGVRDFLYRNKGNGTFTECGTEAGVSFCETGEPLGCMSAGPADMDHDGHLDLFISTYSRQTSLMFWNLGDGTFEDRTHAVGLAVPSLSYVGWGISLLDYDLDGWNDVFVAHGHTYDNAAQVEPGSSYPQPDHLYRNRGGGELELVSEGVGGWFGEARVGRGVSQGDFDGDGDVDLYVVTSNGRGGLIRNDTQPTGQWVRFLLVGRRSNRDAIGARVSLRAEGLRQCQEIINGAGIFCGSDRRLTFGVGEAKVIDEVTIHWPAGSKSTLTQLATGREYRVVEP